MYPGSQLRIFPQRGSLMALEFVKVSLSLVLFVCTWSCVNGQTSLTKEDEATLLNTHNRLRMAVNPPASNMKTMVCVRRSHNNLIYNVF